MTTRQEEMPNSDQYRDSMTRLPQLANPVIQSNIGQEIEKLKNASAWQQGVGRSSETLVKYAGLRIVLVVMKAQSRMNQHHADGPISLQAIEGKLRLHLPEERKLEVEPGGILALEAGLKHDVEALVESAFLLTIAWTQTGLPENGIRDEAPLRCGL